MKTKLLWVGKLRKARRQAAAARVVAREERGIYAASPNYGSSGPSLFEHRRSFAHRSGMKAALRWRYQPAVLIALVILLSAGLAAAGTNEVSALLQKGLFEEEANRNLDAAIQAYQAVVTQTDKNHQFAATAVFRLGECYRKQGKTNEANAQYQRILREFPDQTELVKLSQEYAGGSVVSSLPNQAGAPDVLAKLQQQLAEAKAEITSDQRQIDQLQGMAPERARVFAQQHFPNPILNSLMQDAVKTEQELARRTSDLGTNHPDVQRATVELKTIYQQIDAQMVGIVAGFAEKRNAALEAVTVLERQVEEANKKNTMPAFFTSTRAVLTIPSEVDELKRLQTMIKDSPDLINANSSQGTTPLNEAVKNGQSVVVRFLLDNKADIEGKDRNGGNTPLLSACQWGEKDMVELLLSRGADVNAKRNSDGTALHLAARAGHKAIAEILLAHGANINAKDADGRTPLPVAVDKGFKTLVALFVAHGAEVNAVDNTGSTALVAAINAHNKDMVELLLASKADVNFKNKDGLTPLIAAAKGGPLDVPKLLLEHGADVNARLNDNYPNMPRGTALEAAVAADWNGLVKLLLENHADPNATFDLSDRGNVYQRDATPLIMAVERGQKETVKILLAHKADVNWKNAQGTTALFTTFVKDNREMAALLLDNKADTEIKYIINDTAGRTLLHWAAEGGKKEIAELLLAHGAKIDARDNAGRTPLHLAVSAGSRPMVELLLAHGADVNLKDNQGHTALDLTGNQSGPGNAFTVASNGGTTPLSYQWQLNAAPGTAASQESIGELLRGHGAISALERGTIRITRSGQQAGGVVFWQDAHAYNQHSLFEVIAYVYPHQLGLAYISPSTGRDRDPELPGFYFPDFAHVKIRRLEADGQTNIFNVDLETAMTSGDCSKNMALMWGDIVELPEMDHNVSENWEGLSQPIRDTLKKCLERQVNIIVKRKTNKVTLAPEPPAGAGTKAARFLQLETDGAGKVVLPSFWLGDVVRAAKVLMASSDLTGLKVKRLDPATGKATWLVFNLEKVDEHSDLWLQDGDVIEAPEKQ